MPLEFVQPWFPELTSVVLFHGVHFSVGLQISKTSGNGCFDSKHEPTSSISVAAETTVTSQFSAHASSIRAFVF